MSSMPASSIAELGAADIPHTLLPHPTQAVGTAQEQAGDVVLPEVNTDSFRFVSWNGEKNELAEGENATIDELAPLDQYTDQLSAEFGDYTNRSSNRSQMRNIYQHHRMKMNLMQYGAAAEGAARATRSKPGVQRRMAYFFVTLRKKLEVCTSLPQPAPAARRLARTALPAAAAAPAVVCLELDSAKPAASGDLSGVEDVPIFDSPSPMELAIWYAATERLAEQLSERERQILQQARLLLVVEGIAVIALPPSTLAEGFVSRHAEEVAEMFSEIIGHDVEVKFVDRW